MKRIGLVLLAVVFITVSCALESKFSLPKNEKVDSKLLGTWYPENENDSEDWIKIEALDDFTYKVTLNDDILTAYTTTINGYRIVNVVNDKNENPNMFYGFTVNKKELQFMEVSDKLTQGDFNSQKELIDFFTYNIENANFFVNPEKYQRKK